MSITYGTIKSALQARGYGTDTTAAQTEMVKSALRRLYAQRRWSFLRGRWTTITTTPNSDVISLSPIDDLRTVDAVRLSLGVDSYDLEYLSDQALRSRDFAEPCTDTPQYWTQIDPLTIQLYPTPDRAYAVTIDYARWPIMPTDDTTPVTGMSDVAIEVLVEYACMQMAKRQRDWAAYNAYKADYQGALVELIREDNFRQRQSASEVERWSGWDEVSR